MGSNDYYRFANTITPLAHEARRDPDIAQRQGLLFVAVFVVNAYQATAEGEYFAEGDEDGVVNLCQWWTDEACG